jgi:hypothetical protein
MRTNLDKLVHKILRACSAEPHEDVINAMLYACVNVLQTVDKDEGRNSLILTYIAIILSLVEFQQTCDDDLEPVRRRVFALPDDTSRDLALLQHIRKLVLTSSACRAHEGTPH